MRKAFVWALMAMMAVAGSAYARGAGIVANATFPTGAPATTNNDDSCDISVAPAATLLLPFFDVDLTNPAGETTLFTVTNVSQAPQIAHVTIWTDFSFPVLDFNIFLTGYDVQSINLFDVISRGRIAEPGTSSDSEVGRRSLDNDANLAIGQSFANCNRLAVRVPDSLLPSLQSALTTGRYPAGGCTNTQLVGGTHTNARGYVTIDLASNCNTSLPSDAGYSSTQILYDNVLIGDYEQVNSTQNFAQGNPLVHIRAVPEGGAPGGALTNFDRTFYSRYQAGGTADRRQPLPSTFAARWISGGATNFQTSFKIWREGTQQGPATCTNVAQNGAIAITEFVRFDEEENPTTFTPGEIISPVPQGGVSLPEASRVSVSSDIFPPNPDAAVAGWMYLNLDNGFDYTQTPNIPNANDASQNWVVVSMAADGRYSVDFDAAWLGNGCSPAAPVTNEDGLAPAIGPAANITPNNP
ncbi:MAG TPA: hypothetical protein VJZ00_02530 [Thermoanaerobaculia bacterium]|nr:hypothetical protein [Thermoanaerobaculia bacterium]